MAKALSMPCRHSMCREKVVGGGYCPKHTKPGGNVINRRPEAESELYWRGAWKVFSRQYRRENPLCVRCSAPSTVVDHIHPISLGADRYDPDNLQALCDRCHNSKRYEEGRLAIQAAKGRTDMCVIVCGAPHSGHRAFVQSEMGPEDLKIDDDMLEAALLGPLANERGRQLASQVVTAMRSAVNGYLQRSKNLPVRLWILGFGAKKSARDYLKSQFPGSSVVVIFTEERVCLEQARSVGDFAAENLIKLWHRTYESPEE